MRKHSSTHAVRVLGLVRMGWAVTLLVKGRRIWTLVNGRAPTSTERRVVDVLAIRHLIQGVSQTAAPQHLRRVWLGVDASHALSMVPVAVVDPRHRRAALVTGSLAVLGAVGTAVVAARAERTSA
jgi:hypothetical protein